MKIQALNKTVTITKFHILTIMHVESQRLSDLMTLVISKLGHVILCKVKLSFVSLFQTSDSYKTTCYIMQFKFECSATASSE